MGAVNIKPCTCEKGCPDCNFLGEVYEEED